MSGDVQPRKRKDKRRKKDDMKIDGEYMAQPLSRNVPEEAVHHHQAPAAPSEDFNMHVHHDHGTGGNICSKIIFFILFTVLAVFLVGLFLRDDQTFHDVSKTTEVTVEEPNFLTSYFGWLGDFEVEEGHGHDDEHADHDHEDDHDDEHEDDHDQEDDHDEDEHGSEDHEDAEHENEDAHHSEEEVEELTAEENQEEEIEEQEAESEQDNEVDESEEETYEMNEEADDNVEEEIEKSIYEELATENFNEGSDEESNDVEPEEEPEVEENIEQMTDSIQSEEYDIPEEENVDLDGADNLEEEEEVIEHDDEPEEIIQDEPAEEENTSGVKVVADENDNSEESEDEIPTRKPNSREQYVLERNTHDLHEWKIEDEIDFAEAQLQEGDEAY